MPREGSDLTIVAHGYAVRRALRVAERLDGEGISAEVIDLRSLRPLDVQTVVDSVRKTHRALCVEQGWPTYGVTAELAARIQRACFADLDAPVERVGGAEVPMPYARPLENAALVNDDKIYGAARQVLRESGMLARGVGRRASPAPAGGPAGQAARRAETGASRPAPPAVPWQDRPMPEEIVMPRLSDTMQEGTIARWVKQEGEDVKTGDVLMEVETDKATLELNSYHDGKLARILIGDGGTAPVGTVVGILTRPGESAPRGRPRREQQRDGRRPARPRRSEAPPEPRREPAPAPAAAPAARKPRPNRRSRPQRSRRRSPRRPRAQRRRKRSRPPPWPG